MQAVVWSKDSGGGEDETAAAPREEGWPTGSEDGAADRRWARVRPRVARRELVGSGRRVRSRRLDRVFGRGCTMGLEIAVAKPKEKKTKKGGVGLEDGLGRASRCPTTWEGPGGRPRPHFLTALAQGPSPYPTLAGPSQSLPHDMGGAGRNCVLIGMGPRELGPLLLLVQPQPRPRF